MRITQYDIETTPYTEYDLVKGKLITKGFNHEGKIYEVYKCNNVISCYINEVIVDNYTL